MARNLQAGLRGGTAMTLALRQLLLPALASLTLPACMAGAPPAEPAEDPGVPGAADVATGCGFSPIQQARAAVDVLRAEAGGGCIYPSPALVRQAVEDVLGRGPGDDDRARVCFFEVYANAYLASQECAVDEALALLGVADPLPIAAGPSAETRGGYYVHIGGPDEGCFSERDRGLGAIDFTLADEATQDALEEQIGQTISFLRHFHEATYGGENFFVRSVTICPVDPGLFDGGHEAFRWMPPVLAVGLDMNRWTSPGVQRQQEMIRQWNEGTHLAHLPADNVLRQYWFLINPIGEVQLPVREAIRSIGTRLAARLPREGGEAARETLLSTVEDALLTDYESGSGLDFRARARERIEGASDEEVREIEDAWRRFVTDPESWTGLAAAVFVEPIVRAQYSIELHQECAVNVGNFHEISVSVDAYFANVERFSRYLDVQMAQHDIEVWQVPGAGASLSIAPWLFGGISGEELSACVYTVDDIDVGVNVNRVGYEGSLETAGLELALDQVLGLDAPAADCTAAFDLVCRAAESRGLLGDATGDAADRACAAAAEGAFFCDPAVVGSTSRAALQSCLASVPGAESMDGFLASALTECGDALGLHAI